MQLPDFQRGWIWDDDRIKSLLVSVLRNYPIGAIMRLDSGGNFSFATRPIEGAEPTQGAEPTTLLLDGQQRITSLYQALKHPGPVDTHTETGRRIRRWYYVDMARVSAHDYDGDQLIVSVPEDRRITTNFGRDIELDLSCPELEYAQHLIPTERIFNGMEWMLGYLRYWAEADREHPHEDPITFWERFVSTVVQTFNSYQLPVIRLQNSLPREAVCAVFEKVNTGGVALSVFELLTALFAADGMRLREDWDARQRDLRDYNPVLGGLTADQFLQAVTLAATRARRQRRIEQGETDRRLIPAVGCSRRDILALTLSEYEALADKTQEGFKRAARFLNSLYIFQARDLPYASQLVSLAAIFALMGDELERADSRAKLERLYWSGVFSEDYSGTTETRLATDYQEVPSYVRGTEETLNILEQAVFLPQRLLTLRTRVSAAYKGIHALQMKNGALDWRTGDEISLNTYFDEGIDIHHIFPKAWCGNRAVAKLGSPIPQRIYDSAINKAPLSSRTNGIIGAKAPSTYVSDLRSDNARLDETLRKSFVNPEALSGDDFVTFFVERGKELMGQISEAMGKALPDGTAVFEEALHNANLLVETDEYDDGFIQFVQFGIDPSAHATAS